MDFFEVSNMVVPLCGVTLNIRQIVVKIIVNRENDKYLFLSIVSSKLQTDVLRDPKKKLM